MKMRASYNENSLTVMSYGIIADMKMRASYNSGNVPEVKVQL